MVDPGPSAYDSPILLKQGEEYACGDRCPDDAGHIGSHGGHQGAEVRQSPYPEEDDRRQKIRLDARVVDQLHQGAGGVMSRRDPIVERCQHGIGMLAVADSKSGQGFDHGPIFPWPLPGPAASRPPAWALSRTSISGTARRSPGRGHKPADPLAFSPDRRSSFSPLPAPAPGSRRVL